MRNYTKIKEQMIAQKYRKTSARKYATNYTDEIFMSMEDAEYTSKSALVFTEFVYDTEVYTNLFNDEEFYTTITMSLKRVLKTK